MEPGFTHEILDRLVRRGSLDPRPEGRTFFLAGETIRLHIETEPLRTDGGGEKHVRTNGR
jgi:hypothetical protein